MANAHYARVVRVDRFENDAALLRLEMDDPVRLPQAFAPGQYLIVNSGITLASGKIGKRAYSVFAVDGEGTAFSLAAEKIEGGAVSQYLNSRVVGDQLQFSGPWGKFLPAAESWKDEQPVVGIAVATGITALLGLLADPRLKSSELMWIRDPSACFLPDACIKDLIPPTVSRLQISDLHPVRDGDDDRSLASAKAAIEKVLASRPLIYMAGEGGAIDALEAWLLAEGHPAEQIKKESFFRRTQLQG